MTNDETRMTNDKPIMNHEPSSDRPWTLLQVRPDNATPLRVHFMNRES